MLAEALVITACLQNQGGCSESTSAYYQYNKELQIVVKNAEAYGNRILSGNEWLVYAVTPVAAAISGRQSNIHLYKGWVLGINVKQELVILHWSY